VFRQGISVTNTRIVFIAFFLAAGALPARAQEQDPSDADLRARISELEKQVRALTERLSESTLSESTLSGPTPPASLDERVEAFDQNLRILERKLEIEREAATTQSKVAPAIGASRDGFQLRSADGSFQLRLRGLVQSDGRFFVDDSAEIAPDTFALRRVRPILDATVYKVFDLRLMPDFGGGTTVLQDAYVDLRFTPALRVRGGKFKSPFGLERLVSASELLFLERATPTAVAPNRDVGFMVHGDVFKGDLSYAIGAFDGVVDGGSTDVDDRDGKDLVTRLFAHPFRQGGREAVKGLGIGVAGSYGKQNGSAATPSLALYRTTGQQTFFRYRSDGTAAGTVFADGTRYRWSAQGYYYYGPLGVLAEQVVSSQRVRRDLSAATLETTAWQLAGSWVLTGEEASYRSVTPKFAFDRATGKWGAFEITARYHQLTPDKNAFPLFANVQVAAERARAWTGGLNWYLNRNIKIVLDYEQTHFDGGAVIGDRPTERGVFSRLQFSF
jgi:phosphate-selective porin OprO and OprP